MHSSLLEHTVATQEEEEMQICKINNIQNESKPCISNSMNSRKSFLPRHLAMLSNHVIFMLCFTSPSSP